MDKETSVSFVPSHEGAELRIQVGSVFTTVTLSKDYIGAMLVAVEYLEEKEIENRKTRKNKGTDDEKTTN